ncbi:MAG TPA: protein kinase [Gemmataceae bacterium]|nr:protein kinase [Gemmataceae bacterium]
MKLECPTCHRELEFAGDRPSFCAYCGQALRESTIDLDPNAATLPPPGQEAAVERSVGDRVAGYELLRPLGSGGMGTVYEAIDHTSTRHVALKLISGSFAASEDAIERFRQEGRLASMIVHPRCVFVLAADEEAGQPYIVMELMSGSTLQDLIKENGPLSVEQAVIKIMDVIEGLQEAHRLGVVHRDVKPSNCFVEPDGRVKVGDFGLAKSLVADQHLTKTGSFLGTPQYASPEQVKAEAVDQQTDVYSVAATLYFLLTGRAPFQGRDAAATVAQIVSDSPPSLRTLRPTIPLALEKIVLRGLDRHRHRRWRTLDEFRTALLPFLSAELSARKPVLRIAAFLIDCGLLFPLGFVFHADLAESILPISYPWRRLVLLTIPWILYFLLLEGFWACSLGKRWLRLRVYSAHGNHPAGSRCVLIRTIIFYALVGFPATVLSFAYVIPESLNTLQEFLVYGLIPAVGGLVMVVPMRARNGYRGIHELASGTRVVRLPWVKKRRTFQDCPSEHALLQPEGLPEQIGCYRIQGALSWKAESTIVSGQHPALGRKVWIHLRPPSRPAVTASRREVNRPTRLQWLACGKHGERQWDAFIAPAGWPLPEFLRKTAKLSWTDACPILEQLSDELAAAYRDHTLPESLSVDQLWIQANGRVQLVDPFVSEALDGVIHSESENHEAALRLLQQTAELMLEGSLRPEGQPARPIQAPVPQYAAPILNRLLKADLPPFGTVEELRTQWTANRDRPLEITSDQRVAHLSLLTAALCIPLFLMFFMPALFHLTLKPLVAVTLTRQIQREQQTLEALQNLNRQEFLLSLFQLDPIARAAGLKHVLERVGPDARLAEELKQKIEKDSSLATELRQTTDVNEADWQEMGVALTDFSLAPVGDPRIVATWHIANHALDPVLTTMPTVIWVFLLIFILAFPLIWVVWAFIFRGGFTFRLAGIALLRSNGRKALRIQCAWRALLVWLPVVGLLALSCWLDLVGLAAWSHRNLVLYQWTNALSWVCWGLALLLLPLYGGLVLWLPNRGVHDRLARTYLVPR